MYGALSRFASRELEMIPCVQAGRLARLKDVMHAADEIFDGGWLLPKLLSGDSPRGIRTASAFMPAADTDDAAEVAKFRDSVGKLLRHEGDYAPHPAFGRMSREQILEIHCSHAAHHLRFLVPRK